MCFSTLDTSLIRKNERTLDYNEFIADYRVRYKIKKEQQKLAKESEVISIEKYKLEPNSMQVKFIENVMELYENGENRALLISSTGERGIFVTGGRNPGFTRVSEALS